MLAQLYISCSSSDTIPILESSSGEVNKAFDMQNYFHQSTTRMPGITSYKMTSDGSLKSTIYCSGLDVYTASSAHSKSKQLHGLWVSRQVNAPPTVTIWQKEVERQMEVAGFEPAIFTIDQPGIAPTEAVVSFSIGVGPAGLLTSTQKLLVS